MRIGDDETGKWGFINTKGKEVIPFIYDDLTLAPNGKIIVQTEEKYGVIDKAAPEEALKWFRAIHAVFEKYQISRSVWSYKQMDFGLTDARLDGVREELLKLL